jgi:DNA-binding PadR family transcriptional regulator
VGRNRSAVLELAVLGVLHRTPMHGYELRKQITSVLGLFRALSYGSLYPCLHELLAAGLIAEEHDGADPDAPARAGAAGRTRRGGRALKVYRLTADGKERLQELLGEGGPAAWDDDGFGVHFAFFGQTRADVRLRILEGRRSRLEERMESIRAALTRTRERVDSYTLELHRHGLESVEREVRWLNELIASERQVASQPQAASERPVASEPPAGRQENNSDKESS